jgi:hypothetical protein
MPNFACKICLTNRKNGNFSHSKPSTATSLCTFAARYSNCAANLFMDSQDLPTRPDTSPPSPGEHPPTTILSSNATLFWRIFVPIFGTVFLSGLLLAFWLTDADDLYLSYSLMWPRLLVSVVWVAWLLFVSRTLWRLKRVDVDDAHLYVTDYWTTVRYPWHDVVRMEEKKRLGRRVVNFWLKAPGRFGSVISFLPGSVFNDWKKEQSKFNA